MSDYIYITKPGAYMKVKVEFPHTLIPTEPSHFDVVATLDHDEIWSAGDYKLESLNFIGKRPYNFGKSMFISVSGPEMMNILNIIESKFDNKEFTKI